MRRFLTLTAVILTAVCVAEATTHSAVKTLSPALREVTFTDYDICPINGLFIKLRTILEW